ncbi:MAG: T9SS type A sorting domain-containing protein [Flavobacteriia bacterium]|nr:T9SS type A sorting domain-containing protein [Flavobacteriia bacterium]
MDHYHLLKRRYKMLLLLLIPVTFLSATPLSLPTTFAASCASRPLSPVKLSPAAFAPCIPVSSLTNQYIGEVKFLGTLNQDITNTSLFSGTGYMDYTGLPQKAKQIAGGVVNVNVTAKNAQGLVLSTTKAWVDWNKDGTFAQTAAERVYDPSQIGVRSGNVIFGFVIPPGTPAGFYTLRIRTSGTDSGFDACTAIRSGEAEDYAFEVVNSCAAVISSVNADTRCGAGPVILHAEGSAGTVSYQWYSSEFGPPIVGETRNSFTTPPLSPGTYTYYVAAFNGSCYSTFRTPVKVVVNPTPSLQFTQSSAEICGPVSSTVISSAADRQEVGLLEENFENTKDQPVLFEHVFAGHTNADGAWQLRASPYIPTSPPYHVLRPAISSGYNGGNFASIITDVRQNTPILNRFVLKKGLNTTGFSDLKMEFYLYYFSEEDVESKNYLKLQYSVDDGATWVNLKTYVSDVGVPGRFQKETVPLPVDAQNRTQFKIQFVAYALGSSGEWMADIAAIDHLRLYGNKEVPARFTWSGNIGLSDSSCTGTPPAGGSSSVCINPSAEDIRSLSEFKITATATLANGCNISRTLSIVNNNKVWDVSDTEEWTADRWHPTAGRPDLSKCVLIKKPVRISANTLAEAKYVKVYESGSLNLESGASLNILDALVNMRDGNQITVASNSNLVQVNNAAVNSGAITVVRDAYLKRQDYTYWGSPVAAQNLLAFSPKTLTNRFYVYDEIDDEFTPVDAATNFVPGTGYAIRAPNNFPADNLTYQTFNGIFKGVPNNGIFTFPLKLTGNGYNLISNPYPSNIDLQLLKDLNPTRINMLAYFWTNVNVNPIMQGSNYPNGGYVSNYAVLNGTAGVPATYSVTPQNPNNGSLLVSKTPNRYIKTGQGFIVKSLVNNENLIFNNGIRTPDNTSVFFNSKTPETTDRFWLQLTTPLQVVTTAAIGYKQGAGNGFDADYDAPLMGLGSDALFTRLDEARLAIQGRQYPLDVNDVVVLGTNHHSAGDYTISMPLAEGIFANGQAVYLKDQQTGALTNLSEQSYNFTAEKGLTEGRFEIVYQPETVLGTGSSTKDLLTVYRDGSEFVVKSGSKTVSGVEVYDTSGKLVTSIYTHQTEVRIKAEAWVSGVYVLNIDQGGNITTKKVVK